MHGAIEVNACSLQRCLEFSYSGHALGCFLQGAHQWIAGKRSLLSALPPAAQQKIYTVSVEHTQKYLAEYSLNNAAKECTTATNNDHMCSAASQSPLHFGCRDSTTCKSKIVLTSSVDALSTGAFLPLDLSFDGAAHTIPGLALQHRGMPNHPLKHKIKRTR